MMFYIFMFMDWNHFITIVNMLMWTRFWQSWIRQDEPLTVILSISRSLLFCTQKKISSCHMAQICFVYLRVTVIDGSYIFPLWKISIFLFSKFKYVWAPIKLFSFVKMLITYCNGLLPFWRQTHFVVCAAISTSHLLWKRPRIKLRLMRTFRWYNKLTQNKI